jgi:hypothetical protein
MLLGSHLVEDLQDSMAALVQVSGHSLAPCALPKVLLRTVLPGQEPACQPIIANDTDVIRAAQGLKLSLVADALIQIVLS